MFLDAPIRRGEVNRQRITVGELADGSPIAIPVVTIGGVEDGPTLYLQGGLHGDESTGIEICQRAVAAIEPGRLAGQVVAVPVANVPAYLTRTRGFLHEERWMVDINRVFPGRAGGLLTERLANVLFEQFVKAADFSLDLHSALDGCDIAPFVYIDPDDDQNGTLAKRETYGTAFGTPFIYRKKRGAKLGTSDLSNSLSAQADAQGVPSLTAEMGQSRQSSAGFVPIGVRGVHNVLATMGMVDGDPTTTPGQRTFTGFDVVHAGRGGGLRVAVELGQEVTAGQLVAEVVDVYGQVVERIESPRDGFALRLMRLASVSTGAEVAWVAG